MSERVYKKKLLAQSLRVIAREARPNLIHVAQRYSPISISITAIDSTIKVRYMLKILAFKIFPLLRNKGFISLTLTL